LGELVAVLVVLAITIGVAISAWKAWNATTPRRQRWLAAFGLGVLALTLMGAAARQHSVNRDYDAVPGAVMWPVLLFTVVCLFEVWSWVPLGRLDGVATWMRTLGRPAIHAIVLSGLPVIYARITDLNGVAILALFGLALATHAALRPTAPRDTPPIISAAAVLVAFVTVQGAIHFAWPYGESSGWNQLNRLIPLPAVAAFLGVLTAAIGTWIAWQQHRATRAKLRLDLYDRRFAISIAVNKLLSRIVSNATLELVDLHAYNQDTAQALFLFDADLNGYIEELRDRAVEFHVNGKQLASVATLPPAMREAVIQKDFDMLNWFTAQLPAHRERFRKYLAFDDAL
jgi:hypothetical protein